MFTLGSMTVLAFLAAMPPPRRPDFDLPRTSWRLGALETALALIILVGLGFLIHEKEVWILVGLLSALVCLRFLAPYFPVLVSEYDLKRYDK